MKFLLRLLAVAVISATFVSAAVAAESAPQPGTIPAPFEVSFETSLIKVFPVDIDLQQEAAREAHVSLAANEYEAFQTLILARRDLENATVAVSDLKSDAGDVISDSNITVNVVGYVPVIKPWYTPYYLRLKNQPAWPDPLLHKTNTNIKAGTVQPYWVTVYAPKGTAAGDYRGTVTVSADGLDAFEAPLVVHVWNFEVPFESHLKTFFWLYPIYVRKYHGFTSREDPAYLAMITKYLDEMLAHRMSHVDISWDPPAPDVDIEPGKETDFSAWDAYMQKWIDKGLNFFDLPLFADDPEETLILKARIWGQHLAEKGWLDLAYVSMYDETTEGTEQRAWVHEGDPRLRNALTWYPVPECPNVDIWIPQVERGYEMHPESVEWARKQGKEICMYTSSPQSGPDPAKTAFYPNTNIDFPATHCRLMPWVCWRDDFSGYLYWCINHWDKNPWETAETFRRQNGNGSLFYPGPDGPVASLRAKAFRDGMEDYEYFYMLRARANAAREAGVASDVVDEADKALALWDDTRDFMYNVNRNPIMVYQTRDKVADLIERLAETPAAAAGD